MRRVGIAVTVLVAVGVVSSGVAFVVLGGPGLLEGDSGLESEADASGDGLEVGDGAPASVGESGSETGNETQIQLDSVAIQDREENRNQGQDQSQPSQEHEEAVERGVDGGIELVQAQGLEVSQEQRAAAIDGALESVAQYQEADVEQVQAAVQGATHGTLVQTQDVNASQTQAAVGGASGGALAQHQTVNATQLQSATWGAAHGAIAQTQKQRVTVEQVQVAASGAAAGAAHEAGQKGTTSVGKIQEAAQGGAFGVIEQYQKVTVDQRQRITLDHVQHAAAGASAGALEGAILDVEQEQRVEAEQGQRVTIKGVQKAAMGAAGGALVQRQDVNASQTQAAARGAGKGSMEQYQRASITQIQTISITQIQEASFGAAKGAITQSQAATVTQIQAAAAGSAAGVLVQHQEVTVVQTQSAAVGAAKGAVTAAVQHQVVEVAQIQAAAFGAGEGAVTQMQVVNVVQVQVLAEGASSGALVQAQQATVTQIQTAASGASHATANAVQYQRISVTQLQVLATTTATDTVGYAIEQGTDDEDEIEEHADEDAREKAEDVDEREGEATVTVDDQESDGETVVVESVDLSEGGFVAIHDRSVFEGEPVESVRGASASLESGSHQDVEIELEEPLEENATLVAMVHHDTNGNEDFDYVESGGDEDDPYVGEGGVPVADSALVTLAGEADPDPEPEPEPEATLSVDDQAGNGSALTVDEANASVEYVLAAAYDGERVESEVVEAGDALENHTLDLEPPIEANTTVEVTVEAAGSDAGAGGESLSENETETETDPAAGALANETIQYTLEEDEEEADDPPASVTFADQESNGTAVTVDGVGVPDGGFVAVYDDRVLEGAPDGEGDDAEMSVDPDPDAVVGVSASLEPVDEGEEHESVTVDLFDEALVDTEFDRDALEEGDHTLVAVVHRDTTGSEAFEYVSSNGSEDEPSVVDDEPVASVATVSVDPAPVEPTVEFLNCTAAQITGDVSQVRYTQDFYAPEGFGNVVSVPQIPWDEFADGENATILQIGQERDAWERADGTRVVQLADQGSFGETEAGTRSILQSVALENGEQGPFDEAITNPEGEACIEQVRPDEPTLDVVETVPTDDGIDVTFAYENPNDEPLVVPSSVVEGTTTDEPPTDLEPGEHAFTVEWTPDPEDEDERLVWEISLENHGYDEPVSAATATAGEIAPTAPEFDVAIAETNSPVTEGNSLEVPADVENVGDGAGTQEVTLALDGSVVEETSVTLEPGERESVTLSYATTEGEAGEYTAEIASENDSEQTPVTIESPAFVAVTGISAPESVDAGDPITVESTIENQGGSEATRTVSHVVDGSVAETSEVTLAGGQTASLSYTYDAPQEPGSSTYALETEDDAAQATISIEPLEGDQSTGQDSDETSGASTQESDSDSETPEEPAEPETPEEPETPAGETGSDTDSIGENTTG